MSHPVHYPCQRWRGLPPGEQRTFGMRVLPEATDTPIVAGDVYESPGGKQYTVLEAHPTQDKPKGVAWWQWRGTWEITHPNDYTDHPLHFVRT